MLRRHRRQLRADLCRRALPIVLWLGSAGFTWPGRVPHLVYTLAHGAPAERAEAARMLPQYPSAQTSAALLSALEDADPEVRRQAARASAELGVSEAVPVLLSWLSTARSQQQQDALEALGRLANARALPALERALKDADVALRLAAIEGLAAHIRDGRASPDLLAASLTDPEPALRTAALRALDPQPAATAHAPAAEASSHHRLAPATLAKLTERTRDPVPEVRALALRVLAHVQGAHSVPALTRALEDGDGQVELAALAALGDSGAAAALAPLRARTSGATRAAQTALAALSRIDDPGAGTAIAAQLPRVELTRAALSALLARAQRLNEPATWSAATAAVSGALAKPVHAGQQALLVAAVPDLAQRADASAAAPSLLQGLRGDATDPVLYTRALLALRAPELLSVLTQRLEQASSVSPPLLEALELALEASTGTDAERSALGALLSPRVAHGSSEERARLYRLLALTRTLSAEPEEPRPDESAQELRARASWLGALPTTQARQSQLLSLLRDADASVRRAAASAFAQQANETSLRALLRELDAHGASEPLLQALTGTLVRLDGGTQLPEDLRTQIFERLALQLTAADAHNAAAALDALRTLRDPRAAPHVAQLLRTGSAVRRPGAVLALGDYDVPQTRQLLRFVLQNESPRSALQASLALAELGGERDAEALARSAERGIWPLPAAASYALARIAQRGVSKQRAFERLLCRLGALHDPYVRANVAAGLAAIRAEACDARLHPQVLLQESEPASVRVAAARWLSASRVDEAGAPERRRALALCAADRDPAVAAACAGQAVPPDANGKLLLRAFSSNGEAWTERPVALRMPDGAVYVGPTDANAQVLLLRVPQQDIVMEDPADVPSERD